MFELLQGRSYSFSQLTICKHSLIALRETSGGQLSAPARTNSERDDLQQNPSRALHWHTLP